MVIPSYLEMALEQNEISKNEKISFLVLDVLDVLSSSVHISPECSVSVSVSVSVAFMSGFTRPTGPVWADKVVQREELDSHSYYNKYPD